MKTAISGTAVKTFADIVLSMHAMNLKADSVENIFDRCDQMIKHFRCRLDSNISCDYFNDKPLNEFQNK